MSLSPGSDVVQRRAYLTTVAAALGLAGCSGSGTESTPTTEPTDESDSAVTNPTGTAKTDLTSRAPEITALSLAPDWERPGDTRSEAVSSASVGSEIKIGYQYRAFVHGQTLKLARRVEIFDGDDERVANGKNTVDRSVNRSGYSTWGTAEPFDTSGWEAGEYRAEVTVRDKVEGNEDTATTTFELTE